MGNSCDNDWRCPFVGLDGGHGGVHSGPCQKPEDRMLVYEQKLDNKRFRGQQSKEKSQGQAQPGGAKKKQSRRRSDNPLFLQCLVERLAVFLSFFP